MSNIGAHMQLFIVDESFVTTKNDHLELTDERVCTQLSRVLRAKPGYVCMIQTVKKDHVQRWEASVTSLTAKHMEARILSTEQRNVVVKTAFFIPLPNKREKLELILQKLTEIGVDELILRPAERSQLKTIPEQKRIRRKAIVTEAAEQSRRRHIPSIRFIKDCTALSNALGAKFDRMCILKVFDIPRTGTEKEKFQKNGGGVQSVIGASKILCGLVGPEGGLSDHDYATLSLPYEVISLGDTVLRMETAAIVGAWKIVNPD